jgi:hypothetical protein
MNIFDPLVSGSLSVSGSAQISGSLTVLGGINANLSGTTATASYVEYNNVANKPTLISGSSQISGLGYAITGSNTFNGNQIITGSAFITTRVGINDNTPSYPLDIDGSNETAVIGVKYPISVTSNAVTRIRIDSTQATPNSGFGLYSNGAQKWSIAMFGATSDFTLYNDALLASALLIKGNSSNVLIGTTTDNGAKLQVLGTATFSSSLTASGLIARGQTFNSFNSVRFLRSDGPEMAYIGWVNENTNNSTWYFKSSNGNPIGFSADAINQQVTISTNGNVGIGTTSPEEKFTVAGSGRFTGQATNFSTGSRGVNIDIINASGLSRIYAVAGTGTAGDLALGTDGTERMRVTSGGNVLIGTTTDNGIKLRVNGTTESTIFTGAFQSHGVKVFIYGPSSSETINLPSQFPQIGLVIGNVWGVIGKCTFFGAGGTVEIREFYLGRNASGTWSSASYNNSSNTGAVLQSVVGSGNGITINMNSGSYLTLELSVMSR